MERCLAASLFFLCFTGSTFAANENAMPQPSAVELAMWEFALSTGDPGEVRRFIDLYPNSIFSEDAHQFIEMLANESAETALTVPENTTLESAVSESVEPAKNTFTTIVGFDQPIASDLISEQPKSLQQLAKGTPLYPPVDGLAPEYWKEQSCSHCHQWKKDNLCTQGIFFANHDEEDVSSRTKHPYGGFFKQALKEWAVGGCL